jgi:hypothetical protein
VKADIKAKSKKKYFKKFPKRVGLTRKVLFLGLAFVLVVGGVGYYTTTRARNRVLAASGFEYCVESIFGQACLNAWNGGPFVNVYTHRGVANNYFEVLQENNDDDIIKATGTSNARWNGQCIGDAYNNSNLQAINYETSLDPCGSGWGTYFTEYSCTGGGTAFKDVHSGKFLAPGNFSNGANFTLNGPTPSSGCFTIYE